MAYSKWGLIELMGHRNHYGLISEVSIAGVPMLRVEVPFEEKRSHVALAGEPDAFELEEFKEVHHYSPSSLYGIHELDEATVRKAIAPPEPFRLAPRVLPDCEFDDG